MAGFEQHCIVELMGHAKIAGLVREETVFGQAMMRVDVPKTSRRDAYTKYYGASAIYCFTPTDEATALAAAESFDQPAISPYVVRLPESPALAAKISLSDDDEDWDYDDDIDEDDDDPDYSAYENEWDDDEDDPNEAIVGTLPVPPEPMKDEPPKEAESSSEAQPNTEAR